MIARHSTWLGVAGLLLLTVVVYLPTFDAGYVWDDDAYAAGAAVRDPAGLARIWFEPGATPQYYPVVFSTFWLEYRLWGIGHPGARHAVNVLLHALGAVLLWRILLRLLPGGKPLGAPWVAALVFAVHPVHVESVAWITERKNTLSGVLYLTAMLAYLRFSPPAEPGRQRSRPLFAFATTAFVAAVLSKSVTATLPAAILVIYWWKRSALRREIRPLAPWFGVALAMSAVTVWMEKTRVGASGAEWDLTWLERVLIACRVPWFYAGKLVAPFELTFVYPRWEIDAGSIRQWLFVAATLGAIAVLWGVRERVGRGPLAAVLFFVGTLTPALGFFDVYPFRFSWVADHFQYLASAGLITLLVVAVTVWLKGLTRRRRLATLLTAGLTLGTLAFLCVVQTRIYSDYEALWLDTLDKNPTAWIAHNNLGMLYGERGDDARALEYFGEAVRLQPNDPLLRMNVARALSVVGRSADAEREFRRALELDEARPRLQLNYAEHLLRGGQPQAAIAPLRRALALSPDASTHTKLGHLLRRMGQVDEAQVEYRAALQLDPDRVEALIGEGVVFQSQRSFERAIDRYLAALRVEPQSFEANHNLGVVLLAVGETERAEPYLARAAGARPEHVAGRYQYARVLMRSGEDERAVPELLAALEHDPLHADSHALLARAFSGVGRGSDALRHLRLAVEIDPDSPRDLTALAWALATAADDAVRDGEQAVMLAERARDLTGGRHPATLDALAAAYAEQGRFAEAAVVADAALALVRGSRDSTLVRQLRDRLRLYRSGRPFRQGRIEGNRVRER